VINGNAGRKLKDLDYRMTWDKEFTAFLKKLDAKKPVVWCGDLNVTPTILPLNNHPQVAHQEIDLANPKSNVSKIIKSQ
jgi:exodeoxyribonuclease-3